MIATGPESASRTPLSLPASEWRDRPGFEQGSLSRHTAQDCGRPCPLHRRIVTEPLQRSVRDEPAIANTPKGAPMHVRAPALNPSSPGTACRGNRLSRLGSGGRCPRPVLRTLHENAATPSARADQHMSPASLRPRPLRSSRAPKVFRDGLAPRSGRSHGSQSGVQQPRQRLRISMPNPRPLPHPADDHGRTLASQRTVRGIPQKTRTPTADGLIAPLSEAHPTEVSTATRPSPGRIGTGVSDCFHRGESRSPEGRRRWKLQPRRGDRDDETPRIETTVRRQGEARSVPCSGKATRVAVRHLGPAPHEPAWPASSRLARDGRRPGRRANRQPRPAGS